MSPKILDGYTRTQHVRGQGKPVSSWYTRRHNQALKCQQHVNILHPPAEPHLSASAEWWENFKTLIINQSSASLDLFGLVITYLNYVFLKNEFHLYFTAIILVSNSWLGSLICLEQDAEGMFQTIHVVVLWSETTSMLWYVMILW